MNKEILNKLYVEQNLTSAEVGSKCGKSKWWVINLLRKYGIPRRPRGGGYNKIDLTDERFGKYVVIGPAASGKNANTRWECKCDCGNLKLVGRSALTRNQALSCGKCERKYNWKGCGEISGCYFTAIKSGAKRRHLDFTITIELIWNMFLEQNRKCMLSGLPLVFVSDYMNKGKKYQTASLDRKDSSKGYTPDNIQWIHKDVNFMKQGKSDGDFIRMCHTISHHNDIPKLLT